MRVLQKESRPGEGVGELEKALARVQALNLVCYPKLSAERMLQCD